MILYCKQDMRQLLIFIAEKIWVFSFLEVYMKKKKCKTLESKSINYPRGAEFKAIIHTWKMLILATNLGLILCFYL